MVRQYIHVGGSRIFEGGGGAEVYSLLWLPPFGLEIWGVAHLHTP